MNLLRIFLVLSTTLLGLLNTSSTQEPTSQEKGRPLSGTIQPPITSLDSLSGENHQALFWKYDPLTGQFTSQTEQPLTFASQISPSVDDAEQEPNQTPSDANPLAVPGKRTGHAADGDAFGIVVVFTGGATAHVQDLFRITLAASSNLDLTLNFTNPAADLDLYLFGSPVGGQVPILGSSTSPFGTSEHIVTSDPLPPGTYYVGVSAASGGSDYTLLAGNGGGCSYAIFPTSKNFSASGGNGTINVTTQGGCNWSVTNNNPSFITINSSSNGTGNGTVTYSVAANGGPARNGTLTIAGQTFTVMQSAAGCSYNISPSSQAFGSGGGNSSVNVMAGVGCLWSATSNNSWINVTSGSSGSGNGTVNYSVAMNFGANRFGTITIADQTFTVFQSGSGGNGGQTTLFVDDGSFELATGRANGGVSYRVNRLTPPSYPATLTSVSIFFGAGTGVSPGDPFTVIAAANPSGNPNIDGLGFQSTPAMIQGLNQLNTYNVPNITINSGDFVVGMIFNNAPGSTPFIVDTTPPARQRSYASIDGGNSFAIINGNYAIRAQVVFGQNNNTCPVVTNINPTSGPVGSTVTITGSGFTGVNSVKFANNVSATFSVINDSTIIATVPNGAVNGPITLSEINCANAQTPSFIVNCPTITLAPSTLPDGFINAAYNQTLTASGGTGLYSFAVTNGNLPSGLTLFAGGTLSGTPNAAGAFNFTVTATDANGCKGSRNYTVNITSGSPCVPVSISNSLTGGAGSSLTVPLTVGDLTGKGVTSYDFTLTFDPTVIKPSSTPISTGGTLSSGLTVTANATVSGKVTVSAFGTTPLAGAGTLLNLQFDLIGTSNGCSNLTLTNFIFNEGTPCVTISNGNVCIGGNSISGTVNYGTSSTPKPVPGVTLNAAGTPSASATTNNAGAYTLTGLGNGPYTVTPSKTGDVNGIGAFDASLVSQHVTGLITLTPNQQIAADASGNGTLTAFDASLIAQTAAGIPNPGIAGTWKFVPANRSYPTLSGNLTNQNYDAILVGDVSGNWASPSSGPITQSVSPVAQSTVSLPSPTGANGASLTVPITTSDLSGLRVTAYDFVVTYDPNVLQLQSTPTDNAGTLSQGWNIMANASLPGRLIVSAFNAAPLTGTGTLLNLKFNVVGTTGETGRLAWRSFVFNEGAPSVTAVSVIHPDAVVSVSAASYREVGMAGESLASAFGRALATSTEAAHGLPLPTSLGGAQIIITDSTGTVRPAPLFFVSPGQINYQIPPGTAAGSATVTVINEQGTSAVGNVLITNVSPGLFTANSNGEGPAAAVAMHVRGNGSVSYESVAQFDASQQKAITKPISLGDDTERVYLMLFGTGVRSRTGLENVKVMIGGVEAEVLYAGAQGEFIGLDQINVRVPRELVGHGEVDLVLIVDGQTANTVRVRIQ